MQLSDFYESMQGYTPVNAGIPPAPVAPNPHTQVSPYLRTTQPLPLQYSGDTVKQYHRPGLSSFRIAPLAPAGIPTIVAAAISSAQASAAQITSLISVALDIPNIFTPTAQTQSPDSGGLITLQFALAPEPAGTVLLAPTVGTGGIFDNAQTQAGTSSTAISISGTSADPNELALYWTVSDGAAPTNPNPGAGWTQVSTVGSPLGAGTLYTQFLPTAQTVNISASSLGVDFASILGFVFSNGSTPAIIQKAVTSTGHVGSGTTVTTFSANNTSGNAIIVFGGMSNSLSSAPTFSVADSQGNAYTLMKAVSNSTGLTTVMFIALNIKPGANTVTLTNTNGSGTVVNAIIEYSNIISVPAVPVFGNLVGGTGITVTPTGDTIVISSSGAASGVSSLNSLTGALNIVAGSNITVTPSGSNITISAAGGGSASAFVTMQKRSFIGVNLATTTPQTLGDGVTVAGTAVGTTVAPTSTVGPIIQSTQQVAGSCFNFSGQLNYRTGRNTKLLTEIALFRTTDTRVYVGLSGLVNISAFGNSDNPSTLGGGNADSYAVFRFSTAAGDTTWQAVTGLSGAAQNVQSTGISPDTGSHKFAIIFVDDGASAEIDFYIDGVMVATSTMDVPPANTNLGYTYTVNGLVVASKSAFTFATIDCDL